MGHGRDRVQIQTAAATGAITPFDAIEESGNHVVIQMDKDSGTATVELYARVGPGLGWVLFDTIALTTAGYIKSYDGAPYIAYKVTALSAGTVVIGCSYSD